jgi:hypothetical protein
MSHSMLFRKARENHVNRAWYRDALQIHIVNYNLVTNLGWDSHSSDLVLKFHHLRWILTTLLFTIITKIIEIDC